MKKTAGIFKGLVVAFLVVAILAVLDSTIDLSSDYATQAAQERYDRNYAYLQRIAEKGPAQEAYAKAFAAASEEMHAKSSDPEWSALFAGIGPGEAARAKVKAEQAGEVFDLEA